VDYETVVSCQERFKSYIGLIENKKSVRFFQKSLTLFFIYVIFYT
jgi:hypothetical protein